MTDCSVIHDTFSIERTFPAAPSRVFAAFAPREAKDSWGDTGDIETAAGSAGIEEFDFRPGGRERFGVNVQGTVYRYDALYYDIVPDQRIVYPVPVHVAASTTGTTPNPRPTWGICGYCWRWGSRRGPPGRAAGHAVRPEG
jgi:hypothetical protein